jgi:3-hydroxyisobutyrate dehydrogenase
MGHGMAQSLLRAGIDTTVWDRSPAHVEGFAELGATPARSAEAAARQSDVAITMVPDADAVLAIADHERMLAALPVGASWLQMSTIGVAGFERVAALVETERPDVMLFDAPVSGSKQPALEGELTIFASGPADARARVQPVFDALGQRTLWLGPAGLGSRLKLVNNVMLAFVVEGMGESIALAHHFGLTTEAVIDAVGVGALASPYMAAKLDRIAHDRYDAEFSLSLALKDVELALGSVDPGQLPVTGRLAEEWQQAANAGLGAEDVTAVVRLLAGSR